MSIATALVRLGRRLREAARLMIGLPDYDNYVRHMRERHPERAPMSHAEFVRDRQEARYGRGRAGCC